MSCAWPERVGVGTRRPARPEEEGVFAEGHTGDGGRTKQSGVQGVKAMDECLCHSLQVTFKVHCTTTSLVSPRLTWANPQHTRSHRDTPKLIPHGAPQGCHIKIRHIQLNLR